MEVALRRRLSGVADISISQSAQTVTVAFAPGTRAFSTAAFRAAVAEADVEVLTFQLEACGVVDDTLVLRSVTGVETSLVRLRNTEVDAGATVCVSGLLDDRVVPYAMHVATLRSTNRWVTAR